ncbi:hypothetical protein C8Q80DRAFT_1357688 [Daedaleopsis nitida]|nr:hypothetical protein C8Q80DRAFT_1357688 [Daedaleopsis nitida]
MQLEDSFDPAEYLGKLEAFVRDSDALRSPTQDTAEDGMLEVSHLTPPSLSGPSTTSTTFSQRLVTPSPPACVVETAGDDEAEVESHSSAFSFQAFDGNTSICFSAGATATETSVEVQSPPCDEDRHTAAANQAHDCQDTAQSGASQNAAPQDVLSHDIKLGEPTSHATEAEWTRCLVKLEGRPVEGGRGTFQVTSFELGPQQSRRFRVVYHHLGCLELRDLPLLGGYDSVSEDDEDSAPSGWSREPSGHGDKVAIKFTLHAHDSNISQATICTLARGDVVDFTVVRNRNNHHIGFTVTNNCSSRGVHAPATLALPGHSAVAPLAPPSAVGHRDDVESPSHSIHSDGSGSRVMTMDSDEDPRKLRDVQDAGGLCASTAKRDSQESPRPSPDPAFIARDGTLDCEEGPASGQLAQANHYERTMDSEERHFRKIMKAIESPSRPSELTDFSVSLPSKTSCNWQDRASMTPQWRATSNDVGDVGMEEPQEGQSQSFDELDRLRSCRVEKVKKLDIESILKTMTMFVSMLQVALTGTSENAAVGDPSHDSETFGTMYLVESAGTAVS